MKDSQLSVIIVWRIASYHVPLVIMWIALMKTIGKAPLKDTRSSQYLISGKDNNDSPNSTNGQNNRIDKSDNSV